MVSRGCIACRGVVMMFARDSTGLCWEWGASEAFARGLRAVEYGVSPVRVRFR